MKAYGDNGRTNDVSVKLSVTTENLFLLNDPMYTYIAGEIGGEGKTWMLDAERQDHIGLFNPNNVSDRWWGVSPNGKAGCELYDDEATFILNSERGPGFRLCEQRQEFDAEQHDPCYGALQRRGMERDGL